jgi:hypothetical protein
MTVSINSVVLPDPTTETREMFYRGVSFVQANGDIHHDNYDSVIRAVFTLSWRALSITNRNLVESAYMSLFTADRIYSDMDAATFTVTALENRPKPKFESINSAGTVFYNVSITFKEN